MIVLIPMGIVPPMTNVPAGTDFILFFGMTIVEGVFVLIAWFRETSEIQQLDEISRLRGRLEESVAERTRYTRIAADIAQEIISTSSLEELLNQAANLTTARFGFSYRPTRLANPSQSDSSLYEFCSSSKTYPVPRTLTIRFISGGTSDNFCRKRLTRGRRISGASCCVVE